MRSTIVTNSYRRIAIIVAAVVIPVAAAAFWWLQRPEPVNPFYDQETGLAFEYHADMKASTLSQSDIDDMIIARLTPSSTEGAQYLVTTRRETGFETLTGVTGQSGPDIVLDNLNRSYPDRFPGFRLQRQQTFSLAGVNAAEAIFTYDSPNNGGRAQQHFIALMRTPDEAVYFSFQSLEADFADLDSRYFQPLRQSISFE